MKKSTYIRPEVTVVTAEPTLMTAASPDPPSWNNDGEHGGGVNSDGGLDEDPENWGQIN